MKKNRVLKIMFAFVLATGGLAFFGSNNAEAGHRHYRRVYRSYPAPVYRTYYPRRAYRTYYVPPVRAINVNVGYGYGGFGYSYGYYPAYGGYGYCY